ncbi:Manganese containing catalase [Laceyella tengchongensis]|uniref:Manganese containing catalase n=1 Tax=Laceyella tengchongensis TaxID=574699 RepID=A0AA45WMI2_9BACL|nr:Manganese containing catalase [Laceyella tengchongensis]
MWIYEKKLQYPVRVGKCNPTLAKYLIEQYGGADGELAAALRYLNQRYTLPAKVKGLLTDIGTEEFAHLEMIATMVYKSIVASWGFHPKKRSMRSLTLAICGYKKARGFTL